MSCSEPPNGRPGWSELAGAHWIGPGATPTPTSTGPRRVKRPVRIDAPGAGCGPNRSATPPALAMRVPIENRFGPTATTNCRAPTSGPVVITPPTPVRLAKPSAPGPAPLRRGSWPPTATPSRSRIAPFELGPGCGASAFSYSAQACSWPRWPPSAPPPAGGYTVPASGPRRSASIACADSEFRRLSLSAHTAARTAASKPTVTSSRQPWRHASNLLIPPTQPARESITSWPTPGARGWPPSARVIVIVCGAVDCG